MAMPPSRPAIFVTLKQLQEQRLKEKKQREDEEENCLRKAREEKAAITTPPSTFVTLRQLQELRLAEGKQREEEEKRLRQATEKEEAATIRKVEEDGEEKICRSRRPPKPEQGEIYRIKSKTMIKTDRLGEVVEEKEDAGDQEKAGSSQREIEVQAELRKQRRKKHKRWTSRKEIRTSASLETAAVTEALAEEKASEKQIEQERGNVESRSKRPPIMTRNEATVAGAEKKASEERIVWDKGSSRRKWIPKMTNDETTKEDALKPSIEDRAAPAPSWASGGGFGRAAKIDLIDGERKDPDAAVAAGSHVREGEKEIGERLISLRRQSPAAGRIRGTLGRGRGGRGRKGSDAGKLWVRKPEEA